ncbi:MAG: hypothetical protein A2Y37_04115 [Spirochaetes bacterium GWB1_60_80]|nr:MAG: hypothetical protein A2Y37_04115 [Spirochaetes bacterium GWB1_60_80]HAP44206.1 hypothetical protein [Spirochaetaceae bacterium]HAX36831.1 hypothetical protein [Spirochaetaceae bacterium]
MTIEDLRRTGTLGCAACVASFRTELFLMQRRLGRRGLYAGRTPAAGGLADQAGQYQALAAALARDDFEAAIKIREQLKLAADGRGR